MKYLVVSDVHGNAEAFDAVLEATAADRTEAVLMLGDMVGYGASPNEVMRRLDSIDKPVYRVRGNHDRAAVDEAVAGDFNTEARAAAEWTAERLEPSIAEEVRALPAGPIEVAPDLVICHGSPADEDEYLLELRAAAVAFEAVQARVVFFGHTHLPSVFESAEDRLDGWVAGGDGEIELEDGVRYLVNPGSVGQPRDGDPRAGCAIFDSEKGSVRWIRVRYDVEAAQQKIVQAGLPQWLADRLAVGS